MSIGRSAHIHAFVLALALAGTGCASWPVVARLRSVVGLDDKGGFTEEDLRNDLLAYGSRFKATVVATADQIAAGSEDTEIKRRALLWKLRIVPIVDQAGFVADVQLSYVALFALATAQRDYLTVGVGQDLFGAAQPDAVAASEELVVAAGDIGRRFMNAAELAKLASQVETLARDRPVRGVFVPETVQAVVSATAPGGPFDWITHYPMAPFRALEGVDSGAQAIREFNQTAQRFNQILAEMPVRLRWNVELFSFELEQKPAVESTRASLEELARSSDTFTREIGTLPQSVREQASLLIQQVETSQGQLQKTLSEARGLLSDANGVSERFAPVAAALERTAAQAQQAGVAWAALVAEIRKPDPQQTSGGGGKPFAVLDYERTAAQVSATAVELRGLLSDLRGLDPMLDRVEGSGRSLLNLATWRVVELLLVFFGLLFVYRRVEARIAARRTGLADRG